MKQRIKIFSTIVGIILVLSGIGKSLVLSDFSSLIIQYGFEFLAPLAPIFVLLETIIGLLLFFQIQLKKVSFCAFIFIIGVTGIYIYGHIFHKIEDCGCFGAFSILNFSFIFTIIRNVLLLLLLLDIWLHSKNIEGRTSYLENITFLLITSATSFLSGYTSYSEKLSFTRYEGKTVQNTPLINFISTSKDSTYLVFAFTYSCPHCLNSIENLKRYEESGVVDKVIALALQDTEAEKKFHANFNPNFSIHNYPIQSLLQLTNSFPSAYYIKNNTVTLEMSEELPCSYVFLQRIQKLNNKMR